MSILQGWPGDVIVFILGACIGSFLNVVIYRLPREESIVRPGSRCACGQPIGWRDMIPVISWMLLRGRARCCGRRISIRYPAVEALTACLFLACWRVLPPLPAVSGWIFLSALIAATFIDFDHLIIPDVLTIGLALAGLALALVIPASHGQHAGIPVLDALRSGGSAFLGMLIGSGVLFWVGAVAEAALEKEAMGFGDVKLAGAIGAFCGWQGAVFSLFAGAALGLLGLGLYLAAVRGSDGAARAKIKMGSHIPFGPMLAAGAALYFLMLRAPVDRWFAQIAPLFR